MQMLDRIRLAREGGHTQRVHGTPHHGEYSVGKHSYDALSILLIAHPNPSLNLIKAVLWHDVSERWVGDLPAPVLNAFPQLKAEYERAEAMVQERMDLELPDLTLNEMRWLKLVDRLEFWLWCKDQLLLGNRHVEGMEAKTRELVLGMVMPDDPDEHRVIASELIHQIATNHWTRTREL